MKLSDDSGLNIEVEKLGEVQLEGKDYVLLYPVEENEAQLALIVEKVGDNAFVPVMEERILQMVYTRYTEQNQCNCHEGHCSCHEHGKREDEK